MTKIIAALNLKGGSGKTSMVINLAGVLHEQKAKPVVFDLDPQRSASLWSKQGKKPFGFPVIEADLSSAATFKQQLQDTKAGYILLDCPPQLSEEAFVAALIADLVLIPVTPSPLDLWAAVKAVATIQEARQKRKSKLPKAVLVPSKLVKGTCLAKGILKSLKQLAEPISPALYQRIAIPEATIAGLTIGSYAKNSAGHKEFVSLCRYVKAQLNK